MQRPIGAENGIPTVVADPKKSPSAPAGTRNWLRLVIGRVCVQAALWRPGGRLQADRATAANPRPKPMSIGPFAGVAR
jgi:hypothetical protein